MPRDLGHQRRMLQNSFYMLMEYVGLSTPESQAYLERIAVEHGRERRDIVSFSNADAPATVGVLLDAFIVRSILVTALNLDLGDRMWWPSALSRHSGSPVTLEDEPVTVS